MGGPRSHILKSWPEQFQAVFEGRKAFEFRRDDRGFAVDDQLELVEWDPTPEEREDPGMAGGEIYTAQRGPTGRKVTREITYIGRGLFGVPPGYCVLSLARVPEVA